MDAIAQQATILSSALTQALDNQLAEYWTLCKTTYELHQAVTSEGWAELSRNGVLLRIGVPLHGSHGRHEQIVEIPTATITTLAALLKHKIKYGGREDTIMSLTQIGDQSKATRYRHAWEFRLKMIIKRIPVPRNPNPIINHFFKETPAADVVVAAMAWPRILGEVLQQHQEHHQQQHHHQQEYGPEDYIAAITYLFSRRYAAKERWGHQ